MRGPVQPWRRTDLNDRATLDETRGALSAAAERTARLLRSAPDPDVPVHRSAWTVAEVGAHLVVAPRAFAGSARGNIEGIRPYLPAAGGYHDRMHVVTTATLKMVPERSPLALAGIVLDAVQDFLSATVGMEPDELIPTPWYGPSVALSVTTVTCLALGEQLIHGHDLARTLGQPWPISRRVALLLVNAFEAMLPIVVDPQAASGVRMTCVLHVRGGPRLTVRVDDGRVHVTRDEPRDGTRADCHISAEPVAFALVGYGRINQWQAIASGRLTAWGRRPWMALRFRSLFHNP